MNTDIQESACKHFDFLCSRYGFVRTIISSSQVRFESNSVFFDINVNSRDDICVDFGRFKVPGVFPENKPEELSLGTFFGALETHRGTLKRTGDDFEIQHLAANLEQFGHGLIVGDSALYELARQLRFWHVGQWINSWGTSIVMSPEENKRQHQLLPAIENLIAKISSAPHPAP
jgi:hypothetical protein